MSQLAEILKILKRDCNLCQQVEKRQERLQALSAHQAARQQVETLEKRQERLQTILIMNL